MSQEELDALLLEWQKRLRLQDWRIAAKIVPQEELEGCEGQCNIEAMNMEACVRLNELCGEFRGHIARAFPWDFEQVLVHELLEIHFDGFKIPTETEDKHEKFLYVLQERAINMLTLALVDAKRGNGHAVEAAMQATEIAPGSMRDIPEPVKAKR